MSESTQQLTEEEELKLRAFQRQFDRIRQSSIGQLVSVELKQKYHQDLVTGEITDIDFEGFDPELFQAQVPIFRQFVLQKEPVYFGKIHNIIMSKCSNQDLKDWTRYSLKKWSEHWQSLSDETLALSDGSSFSAEEATNELFYGYDGLFHVKIGIEPKSRSIDTIYKATFQKKFPVFLQCLNIMDATIIKWLDEPELSTDPLPKDAI